MRGTSSVFSTRALALLVVPTLAACAHVSQEDLDGRLGELREDMREEIREGDRQLADRLDGRIDDLAERTQALESDLAALEREFGATVERLETALRFNVPVYFGFDKAEIREEDEEVLQRFSSVVQDYYPEALVTVEGFTDPSGSAEYNKKLGMRRAEAVKSYLTGQGLSESAVRAVSYGEDIPRQIVEGAHGPGAEGWQNRRVVLVIDHGSSPAGRDLVTEEQEEQQGDSDD